MYKKAAKGWLKHWDFILLDLICLQVAFLAAYLVRNGVSNPYMQRIYRNEAIALILIQIIVSFGTENFKRVLKRGYYKEFVATLKQVLYVTLLSTFYLFLVQAGSAYSRMVLIMTGAFYFCLSYPVRILWKKHLLSGKARFVPKRSLLIITDKEHSEGTVRNLQKYNYVGFHLCGLAIMDQDRTGEVVEGLPIVSDYENVVEYICREWVDEVFVNMASEKLAAQVMRACSAMGVTVHNALSEDYEVEGRQQIVERLGNYTVLTTCISMVSPKQMFCKRALDIIAAIVGCMITVIACLFVGPIIYIKSPGPIFFSQVRVGKNGKKFKMYKFRSMYMDAEERKKELMAQNQVEDGMMFKMKDDPRIIKGIGHFIRKTSLDEFPQFFNVLKGEMSVVGTRPPTVDEWERYSLHHRARLAIKPGITGMWQVSGRSEITDFEEVVKLDTKYIEEWSIGLDIKILLKTVGSVLGSNGAM